MHEEFPAWIKYRWIRPDAERWMRPDADRYRKPAPFDHKAFIAEHRATQARRAAEAAALTAPTDVLDDPVIRRLLAERRYLLARRDLLRKYRPDQPRVLAGQPDGGQWTAEGDSGALSEGRPSFDGRVHVSPRNELVQDKTGEQSWKWHLDEYRPEGSLERQTVSNRDGSAIQSLFSAQAAAVGWDERHSILLGDGSITTFENAGPVQTIYGAGRYQLAQTVWTPEGSEPQPIVQQVFAPTLPFVVGSGTALLQGGIATQRGITAGLTLFTWLSTHNNPNSTAVFEFRAQEFTYGTSSDLQTVPSVRTLTRAEAGQLCEKLGNVQLLTDEGVQKIRSVGEYRSLAEFGTRVHKYIADEIKKQGNPNYTAEVSLLKSLEADDKRLPAGFDPSKFYGQAGTVRVDAYEYRPESRTVCIYDTKTENARLSIPRMIEMATRAQENFLHVDRIVVMEVKPSMR